MELICIKGMGRKSPGIVSENYGEQGEDVSRETKRIVLMQECVTVSNAADKVCSR